MLGILASKYGSFQLTSEELGEGRHCLQRTSGTLDLVCSLCLTTSVQVSVSCPTYLGLFLPSCRLLIQGVSEFETTGCCYSNLMTLLNRIFGGPFRQGPSRFPWGSTRVFYEVFVSFIHIGRWDVGPKGYGGRSVGLVSCVNEWVLIVT